MAPLRRKNIVADKQPLWTCAQCMGLAADAPLVTGEGYPPGGVHLHPECRSFWLKSNGTDHNRFRKVVACPPGTPCVQCHSPEGEVAHSIPSPSSAKQNASRRGAYRNGGPNDEPPQEADLRKLYGRRSR